MPSFMYELQYSMQLRARLAGSLHLSEEVMLGKLTIGALVSIICERRMIIVVTQVNLKSKVQYTSMWSI